MGGMGEGGEILFFGEGGIKRRWKEEEEDAFEIGEDVEKSS